jgi:iron complex transport system substrate-binding protein
MRSINEITEIIIDACVCVHKKFGPGLLESVYEKILMVELQKRGLDVECQKSLHIDYEGVHFEDAYRIDLLVNKEVIVELKSTNVMHPVYAKQLKTYLALSGLHVGILANFGMATMKDGLKRVVYEYNGAKPTLEAISAPSASPREENKVSVENITRGAAEIS